MWTVDNSTPFRVATAIVRDKDGAENLVVVVKGTFSILDSGSCQIAAEQVEPVRVAQYNGDPTASSLICDEDFVPTKPTTDILLLGHAYAPQGSQTREIDVGLRVGPIEKLLHVFGDRVWQSGVLRLSPSEPEPFDRLPLVYERAYGGPRLLQSAPAGKWERRNPVGVGFAGASNAKAGDLLPNIVDQGGSTAPAGFGPIARHWAPRIDFAGTYDDRWRKTRFPLLPADCDDRFHQSAPADQQPPSYLQGGEPVALVNLTPLGLLRFELPRVWLVFHTRIGSEVRVHHAKLHTVLIEPDVLRVVMTWHTILRCHGRTHKIQRLHVRQRPRAANLVEAVALTRPARR